MLLLAALPSSWRVFITTQATTDNLQLQNLVAKIQQEEALREHTSSPHESIALATTAKPTKHGKPGHNQSHHHHPKSKPHHHYNN